MVKDILNILGSRLDDIPNASGCKAQINNCLQQLVWCIELLFRLSRLSVHAEVPGVRGPGHRLAGRQLRLVSVRESAAVRPRHPAQASGGAPPQNNNIYNGFTLTITISPELTISKRQHGQPIQTSRSLQSGPAVIINMMINDGRRHLL